MERKAHKNPATGKNYTEKDFTIGKTIYLGGWRFQIQSSDEYTEKYMIDNDEVFPESSEAQIIQKIKSGQRRYASLQQYAIELIKVLDKHGDNLIYFDDFSEGMKKMGVVLTDHEIHVLVRKFDHNREGKISMEEFYNALAAT